MRPPSCDRGLGSRPSQDVERYLQIANTVGLRRWQLAGANIDLDRRHDQQRQRQRGVARGTHPREFGFRNAIARMNVGEPLLSHARLATRRAAGRGIVMAPFAKQFSALTGRLAAAVYPALLQQHVLPRAPMKSADSPLIDQASSRLVCAFRFSEYRSDLSCHRLRLPAQPFMTSLHVLHKLPCDSPLG
jgi:hypothetical protein